MPASELSFAPPEGSLRDRGNRFYQILGGGARMKVLEAFLDLKLPELLGKEGKRILLLLLHIIIFHGNGFIIYITYDRSNGIHENM